MHEESADAQSSHGSLDFPGMNMLLYGEDSNILMFLQTGNCERRALSDSRFLAFFFVNWNANSEESSLGVTRNKLHFSGKINLRSRWRSVDLTFDASYMDGSSGGVFTGLPLVKCRLCGGRGRQKCKPCEATGLANHWLYSPVSDGGWGPRGS